MYREHFIKSLDRKLKAGNDPKLNDLLDKTRSGKLALMDHVIYSSKTMNAVTEVEFFATDDTKSKGIRNVANAKLEEDQFFVPLYLQLLCGDLGGTSDTLLRSEPYTDIFSAGGVLNSAEFTLKVNQNEYIMRESHVAEFITDGSFGLKGTKVLDTSPVIKPNLQMEATLKVGSATAVNLGVSFRMIGSVTAPK